MHLIMMMLIGSRYYTSEKPKLQRETENDDDGCHSKGRRKDERLYEGVKGMTGVVLMATSWRIVTIERRRERTLVCKKRTGIIFEEPNPTGSRQRDLVGLCKQQTKPRIKIPRCDTNEGGVQS